MCGIAGIVARNARRQSPALQAMLAAIEHRGPDGSGTAYFDGCALGHRRLAIVDLESGKQPMASADGLLAVTFNGEIYGYQDLRRRLSDYPFQTSSDTEVILALYERHGTALAEHLPGMFAFALWDEKRRRLFCARDRFGEKPFYYALTAEGDLIFASELKGLLASGMIEPRLSAESLAHYLRHLYVHPHRTIYANVRVLPPGHSLTFENGRVSTHPYWSFPDPGQPLSLDEAGEQFRSLLVRAVQRQLIADVPVGAFLSGGLDSTSVVCAARQIGRDIATYSFDFGGRNSEMEYARAAATHYGTRHVELSAPLPRIADICLRMAQVYDEPLGDSSNIPTYLISQEARRHVKVVLTGDGADELLGGYDWYKPLAWMNTGRSFAGLRHLLARVASRAALAAGHRGYNRLERKSLGLGYARRYPSVLAAHLEQMQLMAAADARLLGLPDPDTVEGLGGTAGAGVDAAMRQDLADYMPGDILVKIDRASMAHGLELRAPFLDVDLASFCISLPANLKVTGTADKIVLRRAMERDWPAAIRNRSKQGFGAPMAEWLAHPDMRELSRESLESSHSRLFDVLDRAGVRQLLAKGAPIQRWALLALALWLQNRQRVEPAASTELVREAR
jgi:asparagine synthase (glutamine-hydrolysing)